MIRNRACRRVDLREHSGIWTALRRSRPDSPEGVSRPAHRHAGPGFGSRRAAPQSPRPALRRPARSAPGAPSIESIAPAHKPRQPVVPRGGQYHQHRTPSSPPEGCGHRLNGRQIPPRPAPSKAETPIGQSVRLQLEEVRPGPGHHDDSGRPGKGGHEDRWQHSQQGKHSGQLSSISSSISRRN